MRVTLEVSADESKQFVKLPLHPIVDVYTHNCAMNIVDICEHSLVVG